MKKMLSILLLFLLVIPMVLASVAIAPYPYPGNQFYGQNQYYYVVFDGEGEASTVARFDIQNIDNISDLQFELPGENIRIISVLQEWYSYQERCTYYKPQICDENGVCTQPCAQYQKYKVYPAKYENIDFDKEILSDSVTINFDVPHQDQETVTILIYYKTESYVNQNGGIFKYDFETITNEFDTSQVRVSIDVAEDLYIKGIESEIEYRDNVLEANADGVAALASRVSSVYAGYIETASGLDPYESFHVTGKYAKSWWAMNGWKPILGIFLGLLALAGLGFGLYRLSRRRLGFSISLGIGSGTLLALSWIGVAYILQYGSSIFGYRSVFPTFLVLLTILWSVLLFVGPAVLVGWKKGVNYGIYTLVATVISAFVFVFAALIVYIIVLMIVGTGYYPVYY